MRILVLGGTAFVGRAIVEDALRSGAEVTLFGRGRTGTDLFPGVPRLAGDRDTGDYTALADGRWDAVVDVSGYVPRHVEQAMAALAGRAGRYLFISSHAVGPAEPVTLGGLIQICARVAGTQVEIAQVPAVTGFFPLVRPYWPGQRRSPAKARAAGMPATPPDVTVADVLAWDLERGEPPLDGGFTPEQEQAVLAAAGG